MSKGQQKTLACVEGRESGKHPTVKICEPGISFTKHHLHCSFKSPPPISTVSSNVQIGALSH